MSEEGYKITLCLITSKCQNEVYNILRLYGKSLMLFDDLTKGSDDFLGVVVCSMSFELLRSILTLERGKMGMCLLVCIGSRAFYFIYIRPINHFYNILCIFKKEDFK